jgi:hypothetical protein
VKVKQKGKLIGLLMRLGFDSEKRCLLQREQ